ncbi:hypothetical protein [Bradyrhizobium viridifuturi]|uniref:hypothetical protein n=1 Tax=Bradyrhizobium viridifuturi TaxID=1654716 RepID=UPI000B0A7897|nr:hypothetical protein [Bradyrhizobium viridifuturi]
MKIRAILFAGFSSLFLVGCDSNDAQRAIDSGCQYLPAAITVAKLAAVMFPGVAELSIDQVGQVAKAACDAVKDARGKSQGKKALITPVVRVNGRQIYLYPDPSRPNQR